MSDLVYRYSFSDSGDDYVIEYMMGDNSIITPTYIDLKSSDIVSYKLSAEQDDYSGIKSVLGIPTANLFTMQLNLNNFSSFELRDIYNATSGSSTALTLYTGYGIDFYYENTVKVTKNGATIFIGVQERVDKTITNQEGFYEIKFVCIIAKALQILRCSDEGLGLTDNSTVQTPTSIPAYNIVVDTVWNFDFFYLEGSLVRGSVAKNRPVGLYARHKFITYKYFFEKVSDLCTLLATKWRRSSTNVTITINNPMALHTFYKQDETTAGDKGAALTENTLGFVFAICDSSDVNFDGLFGGVLKYDSVWEMFRDWFEGWATRSKFTYSTLALTHTRFADYSDDFEFNGNIKLDTDLEHNQLHFNEIVSNFKGNFSYDGAIGITLNESKDLSVQKKSYNNGNLQRLELYPIFHTSPVGVTDHQVGNWWGSKTYNHGACCYVRIISYLGNNTPVLIRAHDVISYYRNPSTPYTPTPHTDVLFFPDREKGDYIGKRMVNWITKRYSNSTSPVITNQTLWTYLDSPSLTFEFTTDQEVDISNLNCSCSFSDTSFIPAYASFTIVKAFITKIEYEFNGLYKIGVTIAN